MHLFRHYGGEQSLKLLRKEENRPPAPSFVRRGREHTHRYLLRRTDTISKWRSVYAMVKTPIRLLYRTPRIETPVCLAFRPASFGRTAYTRSTTDRTAKHRSIGIRNLLFPACCWARGSSTLQCEKRILWHKWVWQNRRVGYDTKTYGVCQEPPASILS